MDQTLSSFLDAFSNIRIYETPVFQMSGSGHCEVAQQQQRLQKDVDTADLNCPPKLANEFLESLHAVGFQLWCLFEPWSIVARGRCHELGWQSLAMLCQVLHNISDSRLYVLFWRHSPARLAVAE
jgi:hypothetical protein